MAQHDYVIANGTGAAVRSDLNAGLAAIVSQNSGATAPSTTYAYQSWADTSAGVMKIRNGANNAWITLYQLDGEWTSIAFENGTAAAPSIYFKDSGTDTGIYSPGADQVGISTGGTVRLTTTTTGITSALPVDVPLGAVGTPSITFTGDLNTGIYSPGADQVAISTNGSKRFFVDANGSIGIAGLSGSNRYLALLDETTTYTGSLILQAGGGSAGYGGAITMYGNSHATYPGSVYIGTSAGSGGSLIFGTNNAIDPSSVERARIDSSGRLLVGTSTSPGGGAACILTDGYARFSKVLGQKIAGSSYTVCTLSGLVAGKIKILSEHNAGTSYKEYSFCYSTNGNALSLIHDNSPYAPGAITLSLNNSTGVVSTSVLSYSTVITIVVECLGTTTSQINVVFP